MSEIPKIKLLWKLYLTEDEATLPKLRKLASQIDWESSPDGNYGHPILHETIHQAGCKYGDGPFRNEMCKIVWEAAGFRMWNNPKYVDGYELTALQRMSGEPHLFRDSKHSKHTDPKFIEWIHNTIGKHYRIPQSKPDDGDIYITLLDCAPSREEYELEYKIKE